MNTLKVKPFQGCDFDLISFPPVSPHSRQAMFRNEFYYRLLWIVEINAL